MNWLSENRSFVIIGVLIIGFIGLAINQKSSSTSVPYTAINTSSNMRSGNEHAKVSLIQYSDFACPGCSYFSTQVMPRIEDKYIKTGKVQFEFRPMAFIQDGSTQAGMGAFCAVDQNKFWQFHNTVYTEVFAKVTTGGLDPKRGDTILNADDVKRLAATAGLDAAAFSKCLDSKQHLADITNATAAANRNGITGTPYIIVNGKPVSGNPNFETVDALIKAAL